MHPFLENLKRQAEEQPMIALGVGATVMTVVTQFIMLLLSSVVLLVSGLNLAMYWAHSSFLHLSVILLYHILTVHGLWYAPIYGWLLLVSACAPRAVARGARVAAPR